MGQCGNFVLHFRVFHTFVFISFLETAICNHTCENGGICIAPDVCSCRAGWEGARCETDIDECLQEGNSSREMDTLCPPNAYCVNKPGWHLCNCLDGFQLSHAQPGECIGKSKK